MLGGSVALPDGLVSMKGQSRVSYFFRFGEFTSVRRKSPFQQTFRQLFKNNNFIKINGQIMYPKSFYFDFCISVDLTLTDQQ